MFDVTTRRIVEQVVDVSFSEAILAQTLQKKFAISLDCVKIGIHLLIFVLFIELPYLVEDRHAEKKGILVVWLEPVIAHLLLNRLRYCHEPFCRS